MLLRSILVAATALAITAHAGPPKKVVLKDFDIGPIKAVLAESQAEHRIQGRHTPDHHASGMMKQGSNQVEYLLRRIAKKERME